MTKTLSVDGSTTNLRKSLTFDKTALGKKETETKVEEKESVRIMRSEKTK